MKIVAAFIVLTFSVASFAENYYVRKTAAGDGVSVSDANHVRDAVQEAVTASNNRIAKTPGDANLSLRAVVNKVGGGYSVRIEKYRGKNLVTAAQSSAGSSTELVGSARKTTDSLVGTVATNIPADNNDRSDVVVENYPTDARVVTSTDAAPTANGTGGPINAVEARHANYVKNWYASLGPVVTNTLLGSNGTKFSVVLGYNQGLSERIDLMYFYDGNFNTASVGSTATTEIAAGGIFYLSDRGADTSGFLQLDLGFGGGNKQNDAGPIGGVGVGVNFFRTKDFTAQLLLRMFALYSNGSSLTSMPNDTEVRLGIYF